LVGILGFLGFLGYRIAGRPDASTKLPTEASAPVSHPIEADALYAKIGKGDHGAVHGLAEIFRELDSIRATRTLSEEEYMGFLYSAFYLCQPIVRIDDVVPPLGLIAVTRARYEQAKVQGTDTSVLSAAKQLAELIDAAGDPDEAREILRETVKECAKSLPAMPLPLATLYYMESTSVALEIIEPVLRMLLEHPELKATDSNLATLHGILADLYIRIGNTDDAAKHMIAEAKHAEASGDPLCRRESASRRASVLMGGNRPKAANRWLTKWLEDPPVDLPERFRIRLTRQRGLARAELYREDPDLAALGITDLDTAIESGLLSDRETLSALHAKTMLHERLDHPDEAREAYLQLDDAIKRTIEAGGRPSSEAACTAGVMQSRLSEAPVAEVRDGLEACALELFGRVKEFEPSVGGTGFFHFGSQRDLISELVQRCLEAEPGQAGLERALDWILKSQALGSMARIAGYEYAGLDEVRAALVTDTRGVLVYLPSPLRTHVFGFDADNLWHEELGRAWFIEEKRSEFLQNGLYTDERGPYYDTLAGALAQELFPPQVLAHMENWQELSIGGLGLTDYIPYEILPVGADQLFGERFDVAYLPSVPIGEVLADRSAAEQSPETPPVALFVSPTTPSGLEEEYPPILVSENQMQRLGSDRPDEVSIWSGNDATFENLKLAASSGAKVLHLIMHGAPDPNRVRPAGLLFAEGATGPTQVSCRDIEQLEQVPPIVILAVCGAQKGRTRKGEDGLTHLGGAFISAGAQVVILSPDDLEVNATIALVALLQDRLLNEEAPASALAGAIKDLRRKPEYRDPKFAAMHVMGLGFQSFQ
jgi:hypothetical protein